MNNGNNFNQYNNGGFSYQTVMEMKSRNRGFAIASMILGILSILCCCFTYIGIALSIIAIVFAVVSRVRMGYFDGMAIAGLVLGIIGFVFGVSILIIDIAFTEQLEAWLEANYPEIYEGYVNGESQNTTNGF